MSSRIALHLSCWFPLVVVVAAAACGGTSSPGSGGGVDAGTSDTGKTLMDAAGAADVEAGAGDDSSQSAGDGTPTRTSACTPLTQQTGTALDTFHGRIDGYLTYVVPQGGPGSCNGDNSHVHLQIKMLGNIYDVAVDIGQTPGDALLYEADMPMPGGAWSEGWHDIGLSYPQLGVHSTQFTSEVPATLGQKIQTELANVNHISVFGESYSTYNGCHDVHYENGTDDGALIIDPLSPTAHILFFRFSTDTF
jgi:hypothetical protein